MNVACVLLSWRPDEPAGMERSVASLITGLQVLGHEAFVISAAPQPPDSPAIQLTCLPARFPCDDHTLRAAIDLAGRRMATELTVLLRARNVDVVYYVDALWGLGRAPAWDHPARHVLGVHVVGHDTDLAAALHHRRPNAIIAPSRSVLAEARAHGHDTADWTVVPNGLLIPGSPVPDRVRRQVLRAHGPVRVLARLGAEKGIDQLLDAAELLDRPVDIALAEAGFEPDPGAQARLRKQYVEAARRHPNVALYNSLPWSQVPGWLAEAAVVVVPSQRETFGLVALEALSVGTPVVAYAVGNLPDLIGDAGVLVPPEAGAGGLATATRQLLHDPLRYDQVSTTALLRASPYRPDLIADRWLEAVLP